MTTENPYEGYEGKSIYLKKDGDVLGLHAEGFMTDQGFQQIEAWCNAYTAQYKFMGSVFRLFGPIEQEAEEMKKEGWVVIPPPPPPRDPSTPPLPEAA